MNAPLSEATASTMPIACFGECMVELQPQGAGLWRQAFAAGCLAARTRGFAPVDAAKEGKHLAAAVVMHPGAIIPQVAMPGLWATRD